MIRVGQFLPVFVWKFPVLLITIGITSTCSRPLLCSCMACLSGAYIVWICSMISKVLMFVEYVHSINCRHFRPLYVGSASRAPREFTMYPNALIMRIGSTLGMQRYLEGWESRLGVLATRLVRPASTSVELPAK